MKTYIVGNWKMNFNVNQASVYLHKLIRRISGARGLEVAVLPSFLALQPLALQLARHKNTTIKLGAQNIYHKDFGAYTGEVSATQLRGLVKYALIGHSERRYMLGENENMIRAKVAAALRNKITPILCIGETADERNFNETYDTIRGQIIGGLADITKEDLDKIVIAYEPVWAISSNKSAKLATPDEVAEVVRMIRATIRAEFRISAEEARKVPILYGGSVSPDNAGSYLTIPGINGLLIGGASLILDQFVDIIDVAKRVKE